jgi:hypothetical protein
VRDINISSHNLQISDDMKPYVDRPEMGAAAKAFFLFYIMLMGVLAALLIYTAPQPTPVLVFTAVLLIVLFTLWSFWSMKFVLTDKEVLAYFGPFKSRTPYKNIKKTWLEDRPYKTMLAGWGWRLWWGKGKCRMGFVTKYVPSLVILRKKAWFKELALTCHDSKKFQQELEKRMKK